MRGFCEWTFHFALGIIFFAQKHIQLHKGTDNLVETVYSSEDCKSVRQKMTVREYVFGTMESLKGNV